MASLRDFDTEALAIAAVRLGWPAHCIQVIVSEGESDTFRFVKSPATSVFGLYVDLTKAYEPEILLFPLETDHPSSTWLSAFKEGLRTSKAKMEEIKNVNRGIARGPIVLDY